MKHKHLIIVSTVLIALLLAGGGYGVWRMHSTHTTSTSSLYGTGYENVAANDTTQTGSGQSGQQTISAPAQTGTALASQTTQSQQSGASTLNSNASAAASKLLDPTGFSQYDRYKSETNAQYVDLQQGTGTALAAGQTAAVYYRGWLTNGTMFDQSRNGSDGKLQTFNFKLGDHQVISGWEQGLAGMKVGGVRLLIVPPAAGYGASGQGSTIPGNSVLVFQVQLVAVQ